MKQRQNNPHAKQHPSCQKHSPGVIIAAGGTGGHLYPGIAIAKAFIARDPHSRILFVGTGKPFEQKVLSKTGFASRWIPVEGILKRGLLNQIRSLSKLPWAVILSISLLCRFRPDLVIGVGSYVSGPVSLAARAMGIPVLIHEQNILPGVTNRILARFAARICVSFEGTRLGPDPAKITVTGNPVRQTFLDNPPDRRETNTGSHAGSFTVLVLGGSQGAHEINTAITRAIQYISPKERYFFVHQTGSTDEASVQRAYRDQGVRCRIEPFFEEMAQEYHRANLVICRAGATTVAELSVMGIGAIFIPFPHATDNHQVKNAQIMERAGAAEIILEQALDPKKLAARIDFYATNRGALNKMCSRAAKLGKPYASASVVDESYRLMGI
jgi:UDP-N-acetylglucosamine--N-acetylmuramyl-(pentapeptide) pyrophosphoryl-undecaprenol N-acetylglucosamine transferase